ncbi:MAG: ribonuclease HII [Trueperaceae bacterium]
MPKPFLYTPDWQLETQLFRRGYSPIAGIDEAGRGALAGPVVAAVVVLPVRTFEFRDSKQLSPQQRESMAEDIKNVALAYGIAEASAEEVDNVNVLKATHLAAGRALSHVQEKLKVNGLVTDFLKLEFPGPVLAVAKGDSRSLQIAAASILAKTTRDNLMKDFAELYPQYGFEQHKGYGSPFHLSALKEHGLCPLHRRSYKPVVQVGLFPTSI